MNYLDFYHFDNHPFIVNKLPEYFFKRKSFVNIMEQMLKLCRIYNGVYIIQGGVGIGKSLLLEKLYNATCNTDISILINMTEKTDILKIISNKLKFSSKSIDTITNNFTNFHEKGKNIILFLDDVHKCNLQQFNIIGNLILKMPFLKIILTGENIYPIIKFFKLKNIKSNLVKKYDIKKITIIESIKYLNFMISNALAIKQYKKILPFKIILLIAFLSDGNINTINKLTNDTLVNGFTNSHKKIKLKDLLLAISNNKRQIGKHIFYKIKRLISIFVICLLLYFSIKIITDRYNLIETIKIKKEIFKKELFLQKQQNSETEKMGRMTGFEPTTSSTTNWRSAN